MNGLKPRGKLLVVAASFEPLQISALSLLTGKAIAGWPSGSAIDSEETMAFSALTGVRPRIEKVPLEKAEGAFGKVMANRVRLRAVPIHVYEPGTWGPKEAYGMVPGGWFVAKE